MNVLFFIMFLHITLTSCVKRVQLPEAFPFPKPSPKTYGSGVSDRLRQQIDQRQAQLWRWLEQHWKVKDLKGKLWVQLRVEQGKITQCLWRRSELEASVVLSRSEQSVVKNGSKESGGSLVCAWFQSQEWSSVVLIQSVVLEYVVVR